MTNQEKNCRARLHLVDSHRQCQHCQAEKLCLSFGLDQSIGAEMRDLIQERGPFQAGDTIYRQSDPFRSIYSIQSGCVKAETVTVDGRASVVGFFHPGDLAGLDGIGSKTYPTDLIALETTWICEIPYKELLDLCGHSPKLQSRFIERMGMTIQQHEQDWKVLRSDPAEIRVMRFLYQLHERNRRNGSTSPRVKLPMAKQDLASYLSLTPESLSRVLTRMQTDGYILKESQRVLVLQKSLEDELGLPVSRS
ncbi:hypothetical protein DV711_15055 [Motiliproteus coralliicola]|uniref:Crp/Fnr family transcriptional regulator n=1 Tax=Motiliproteus coralliicola TaxID=2283196 RepID=A0A369WB94_9GAMM|nr:cyclic nucleotide-binding domain-containing protein [Motiliproteus coralliicola]RDE18927.1 hypothetical protein DV711_15055 [Motiliproteus coralliicola]